MAKKHTILITGGAGFIGSAVAKALMDRGDRVVLIDNFNDVMYDPAIKRDRIATFLKGYEFALAEGDIRDKKFVHGVMEQYKPTKILHLAALAGVRKSLEDPAAYVDVNILATTHLLELAKQYKIKNFVYASSSSVYGNNSKLPFSEKDSVDTPISPYAATKKADELMAHVYSSLYKLPTTGLRFFTVYGPWGRPDMALYLFTDAILNNRPIKVFNKGEMYRSFTYIDDIVAGTIIALDKNLPYEILNIGGDREEKLTRYIEVLETALGKKAKKKMMKMQPGDVPSTRANTKKLRGLGWKPRTLIDEGVPKFVSWYREYYGV
jgi:UDP-glucuronate 4-epimerase